MLLLLLIISYGIPGIEPIPFIGESEETEAEVESIIKHTFPLLYDTNDLITLEADTIQLYTKALDSTCIIFLLEHRIKYTFNDIISLTYKERNNMAFVMGFCTVVFFWDLTPDAREKWYMFLENLLPKRVGEIDSLPKER
jgi:hypothetical protein